MSNNVVKRSLRILVASDYQHSGVATSSVPEGEVLRFGKHFTSARKQSLVGIESGRNSTCFEVAEHRLTKAEYIRLIGDIEEATRLLRAAAHFEMGDIIIRRGMVFERIARSFKPGQTFDLDISGFSAKYGHL